MSSKFWHFFLPSLKIDSRTFPTEGLMMRPEVGPWLIHISPLIRHQLPLERSRITACARQVYSIIRRMIRSSRVPPWPYPARARQTEEDRRGRRLCNVSLGRWRPSKGGKLEEQQHRSKQRRSGSSSTQLHILQPLLGRSTSSKFFCISWPVPMDETRDEDRGYGADRRTDGHK